MEGREWQGEGAVPKGKGKRERGGGEESGGRKRGDIREWEKKTEGREDRDKWEGV